MSAFNVVRVRVKPEHEKAFLEEHRQAPLDMAGMRRFTMIKTGERAYCIIGEWADMSSIANARPAMIARLNRFRDMLEDLGGGLGVTDPVSGAAVVDRKP